MNTSPFLMTWESCIQITKCETCNERQKIGIGKLIVRLAFIRYGDMQLWLRRTMCGASVSLTASMCHLMIWKSAFCKNNNTKHNYLEFQTKKKKKLNKLKLRKINYPPRHALTVHSSWCMLIFVWINVRIIIYHECCMSSSARLAQLVRARHQ